MENAVYYVDPVLEKTDTSKGVDTLDETTILYETTIGNNHWHKRYVFHKFLAKY